MHHVTAVCLVLNKETPFSYASLEQPLKSALLKTYFSHNQKNKDLQEQFTNVPFLRNAVGNLNA